MDTSEQYINMCRQAKELQETWLGAALTHRGRRLLEGVEREVEEVAR